MKLLLLLLPVLAVTGENLSQEFSSFVTKFGKIYSSSHEAEIRKEVFRENVRKIEEHNSRAGISYKKGINQFSDLTEQEFRSQYLTGYKKTPAPLHMHHPLNKNLTTKDLPASVDWRTSGAVTPVKNQGQCGSCWAFATTEVIESHVQIATGTLPVLSPQQVTSCTPNPLSCGGTGGCLGSIPQLGYTYIQLFGQVTEDEYPYVSGTTTETEDCMYDLSNLTPVVGLTGYNVLEPNNMMAVMTYLATQGPLIVAADASRWNQYDVGVFDGCHYDQNIALNHAVVLDGYGVDEVEGAFWLIRNSWGEYWGEDGYIRLKMEDGVVCGEDNTPMDGTACVGGPGSDGQTVCGMCGVLFDVSHPLGAHLIK